MANQGITINNLATLCANAKKAGLGSKRIMISDDDEGNGYHELFFGFTKVDDIGPAWVNLPYGIDAEKAKKEYIILG